MKKKPQKLSSIAKNKLMAYISSFNFLGIAVAGLFFCLSLLPSLLPRPWLYQGLISGLSLAIGYSIGVFVSYVTRWLVQKEPPANIKRIAWKVLIVAALPVTLLYVYLGSVWQNQVRTLVGEQPLDGRHLIRITLLSFVLALLLIGIARVVRSLSVWLGKLIDKFLPRRLSYALSITVLSVVAYWFVTGVLLQAFVNVSNNIYKQKNTTTLAGVVQPTEPTRSGSSASYIPWDTLGYQGRTFVASGPNQQQMANFNGQETKQQVRIYSGLDSAPDAKSRAALALKDLERAGGFDRKVLVVATATGTGWLEPQSVDSLEYMYGGDTAIVSQQYSYLPSWISFLVDKQNATDAGQELFDAIYGKWVNMPAESRPKLITYGLSLGSFGGQAAFSGVNDLKYRTDGALFMGTPSDTSLWWNITNNRDRGTPEWQPTYENGQTVRFAATNENITQNQSSWQFPRVLYMQHASDPVVWFNFNLITKKPDWLNEKRGPDVSPTMRWYPFVTFFQVTVDQFFGVTVPNGHGHNYPNTIVNSWASVVPPAGWNAGLTQKLQDIIANYQNT